MSDIYNYQPQAPYLSSGYLNNSHSPQGSPFIPHISPYLSTTPLPGSPQLGTVPLAAATGAAPIGVEPNTGTSSLLFPGFDPTYQPVQPQPDVFSPLRPRRPSWHGQASPFFSPPSPAGGFLSPGVDPLYHSRRRSFGGGYDSPMMGWGPQIYGNPLTPSQFDLHPWLNAQTFTGEFLFDLSAHNFNPLQLVGHNQTVPVPLEWLMMPATRPPINRLRVVCDLLPQWPIDVEWNSANATSPGVVSIGSPFGSPDPNATPPITLSDVLFTIHRSLHTRISHSDWAKLTLQEETAVARVYTKRCKAMGSLEAVERAQGVKRIDFLLGKVWFRGLVMDWGNGVMKLIVG
ncbi:hypothetical protein K435DRAFT_775321 [Dendrothele bispora CBS 962.96]|uniref:DUF6699 domain-containing protein n=1 Tax=Dendrothele bispora (strain CBS 962.96) TaxID=1314807 RepID=A0A4S8MJE5_DENBC|nr:hypothetical protein K435DRAFT_775321 [Dendrothele bispora CBS 962.96]